MRPSRLPHCRRRFPSLVLLAGVAGGCGLFPLPRLHAQPDLSFIDVTKEAGIEWVHDNGMSPRRLLPETMVGGGAVFDYDNDGWMDIYLVTASTADFYKPSSPRRNALYRNNGDGTFTDVTERAGVGGRGFASGAAAGDYDGDGWTDLYVTGVRFSILYRNRGDGTFEDVTGASGTAAPGWSSSAAWLDYDRDGRLDLWVCGYVIWEPELNHRCGGGETPRYCIPTLFDPHPSTLFRNRGDGTFEDVSRRAGINDPRSKGLGVVAVDLDGDGWLDVFQSNDTSENFLFRHRRDGTFEELGLPAGVAFSHDGRTRSGMGVDSQDVDGDGRPDLVVANIDHEDVAIYRNAGNFVFEDLVLEDAAVAQATRFMSNFAARLVDVDNDGDHDLVMVNGHPDDQIDLHRGNIHYLEKPQLFENRDGRFMEVSSRMGPVFRRAYAGRGLATGDLDNDGDVDLVIINNGQPPVIARNDGGNRNAWIGLRLIGKDGNRDAVGARIRYRVGGRDRYHFQTGGASYQSGHDPRIILGLGTGATELEAPIRVEWPSGSVSEYGGLKLRRYHELRESGDGSRE